MVLYALVFEESCLYSGIVMPLFNFSPVERASPFPKSAESHALFIHGNAFFRIGVLSAVRGESIDGFHCHTSIYLIHYVTENVQRRITASDENYEIEDAFSRIRAASAPRFHSLSFHSFLSIIRRRLFQQLRLSVSPLRDSPLFL